jgi:hypothetical protein
VERGVRETTEGKLTCFSGALREWGDVGGEETKGEDEDEADVGEASCVVDRTNLGTVGLKETFKHIKIKYEKITP